jgi:YidC/Oxa1 family membrane protein insertase
MKTPVIVLVIMKRERPPRMADNLGPNNAGQIRRLLLAVGLSAVILLGADFASMKWLGHHALATMQKPVAGAQAENATPAASTAAEATAATISPSQPVVIPVVEVPLESERMAGTISSKGGQFDNLTLKQIAGEITDEGGFQLLRPFSSVSSSYVASGWTGAVEGPNESTLWQVVPQAQGSGKVVLQTTNTTGQTYTRTFMLVPDSYLVDVTEKVTNNAELPVSLNPYVQVRHEGGFWNGERGSWVNSFGPMGVVAEMKGDTAANQKESGFRQFERSYKDLAGKGPGDTVTGAGGWWGITSQYFMTAVLPETVNGTNMQSTRGFQHNNVNGRDFYTASVSWPGIVVQRGGNAEVHYQLYTGPKHYPQLKAADHHLERAISWGWFEILVKAFYAVMVWLHGLLGNWGLAVIGLTILLKLLTFPLANKSYHSMAKMRKLQPKIEEMKARYKGDQQAMGVEMMKLYKKEKVNPLSGCWPMLIQIPIFFAMYKVVLVMFEFRHAPLGLWITDMSLHDPYFVLPILMGISMYVQFKLNPAPSDPTQAAMFKWMPVFMTVMFLYFPAGLVLYWFTSNVLSIAQQAYIMRKDKAL